jgi:hypothetical protein
MSFSELIGISHTRKNIKILDIQKHLNCTLGNSVTKNVKLIF